MQNRLSDYFEQFHFSRDDPQRGACDDADDFSPAIQPETYLSPEGVVEVIRLKMQMAAVEAANEALTAKVEQLSENVSYLMSSAAQSAEKANYFDVQAAIAIVEEFTRAIFSGEVRRTEHEDCELSGERYFKFTVFDSGSVDEVMPRVDAWHREAVTLAPNLRGMFRLSVDT